MDDPFVAGFERLPDPVCRVCAGMPSLDIVMVDACFRNENWLGATTQSSRVQILPVPLPSQGCGGFFVKKCYEVNES